MLTFRKFSQVNRARCESEEGFNHNLSDWSTSDWFLAMLGEFGEAANIAKKLNRVRDGIPGNTETEDELRVALERELADTFIYFDLLCQSVGVDVGDVVQAVFDRKSKQIGYPSVFVACPPDKEGAA